MLGPIPNALGAGGYNGTFFPHGLVTFVPSLRLQIPDVLQEVCLDATLHPTLVANAELLQALPINARLDQLVATPAVLHPNLATDAELLQDLQLDAIIEECP